MSKIKKIKIVSLPENLSRVEVMVDELTNELSLGEEFYGKLLIACIEAVNNSIIHGNKSNPDKYVDVEVLTVKKGLRIVVSDEGKGFDFDHIPDPTAPENIENLHGRGIFLMNHLSDKVKYQDSGSVVEMTFNY